MMGKNRPLRIVFMGTPDFAATILQEIITGDKWVIVACYCQPDRPVGRGHKLKSPPVKIFSEQQHIPVYQPVNFKNKEQIEELESLAPDLLVVAAYGLILPQAVLDIPKLMPLNIHASLLPFYRGAAPIQHAIMSGDKKTGITIMRMEKGMDTGPIIDQQAISIELSDTSASLSARLAPLGGELLIKVLDHIAQGKVITSTPQDNSIATYACKLTKADGNINWDLPAKQVHNIVRGVTPWPGAHTTFDLNNDKIVRVLFQPGESCNLASFKDSTYGPPGKIISFIHGAIAVACKDVPYLIYTVRPDGGKTISAEEFWNGYIQKYTT